ncbi:hypothetical protein JOD67_006757 [Tenggerimyces flavus]|nr:hypothetical protein [Tenggerimyces flavus]
MSFQVSAWLAEPPEPPEGGAEAPIEPRLLQASSHLS